MITNSNETMISLPPSTSFRDDACNVFINVISFKKAMNEILEIFESYDTEYDDSKTYASIILRLCSLRSVFLMLDDTVLEEINDKYHEFLNCYGILNESISNEKSRSLIRRAFLAINDDKKRFGMNKKK